MLFKKISILLIGLLSLTLYSCSDSPTSAGKGILKTDLVNIHVIDSFNDSIPQSSSVQKKVLKLGSSERNLIGKNKNVEASTLMNFYIVLADSIENAFTANNLNILSATVEFYANYTFGDSSAQYDFTAHKVNSGWTVKDFSADNLPNLSFDQADVSSNRIFTDSLTTFELDNNLIKNWFQFSINSPKPDSLGIYIKPTYGTQKVVGYQALALSFGNLPTLKVVVEKPGSYTDTLSFLAGSDLSVVTGTLPNINSEDIAVQGGLAAQSKLNFDVSKISTDAVINNASLTLYLDTVETFIGTGSVNSLSASYIVADSTLFSVLLSRSGNTYTGNIASFVQRWVRNKNDNQGILLKVTDETGTVDLFALKGSNAADLALRPKLTITYLSKN